MQGPTASQEQGGLPSPPAHPHACKTFQVQSPPVMLPQRSLKQLRRAHGGLSRLLQGPIASQEQGGSPSHTPYSKALENLSGPQPSIWASNILFRNTYAERGGLSRVVRGPTALKKQGGSRTSLPTRKHGRPFRSKKPPLMLSNTSEKQLNGARRSVTRCARTHRPQTSREGRNLPLLASLENLSGLQPSLPGVFCVLSMSYAQR